MPKKISDANLRDEKYKDEYAEMLETMNYWMGLKTVSDTEITNAIGLINRGANDIFNPMRCIEKYDTLTSEEVKKDCLALTEMLDKLKEKKDKSTDNVVTLIENSLQFLGKFYGIHSIIEAVSGGEKYDYGMEDFYSLGVMDIGFRLLHDVIEDVGILGKAAETADSTVGT